MAIKTQLGIVPEIYEKTSAFADDVGAGLGMYPNGLRVLRDISPDLSAAVRKQGHPYMYRRWERHDGTEIMQAEESVLSDGDKDLDSLGIRRARLQRVLYEHAISLGITIRFSKATVAAVERDDDLIEVFFTDGTSRLTRVLFGADGGKSTLRSIVCGGEDHAPQLSYTGVTCLMGLSECPSDEKGVCFPSSDKEGFHAVFFPTGENEQCFQFHFPVPENEANKLNWGNLSCGVGKEECAKLADQLEAEGWHGRYLEPLRNVHKAVRVGFALLEPKLTTWVKGRIALVGDAAHPPVPYVGQGAQQGLEDAAVLVSLLKVFCLEKFGELNLTNFGNAMQLYQDIRIPRSSQILSLSKSFGSLQSQRTGPATDSISIDDILKGEVLMYGTLPIMLPGADHDYKDDIRRATEEHNIPTVTIEEAEFALDVLFGAKQPSLASTCKVTPEEAYDAWQLLMNGCV